MDEIEYIAYLEYPTLFAIHIAIRKYLKTHGFDLRPLIMMITKNYNLSPFVRCLQRQNNIARRIGIWIAQTIMLIFITSSRKAKASYQKPGISFKMYVKIYPWQTLKSFDWHRCEATTNKSKKHKPVTSILQLSKVEKSSIILGCRHNVKYAASTCHATTSQLKSTIFIYIAHDSGLKTFVSLA